MTGVTPTCPIELDDSHEEVGAEAVRPRQRRPWWIEWSILIASAMALTFLIQTFVAGVYYIPSVSMDNTLHGDPVDGDRVLVNKVIYGFTDPAPGDVVVFHGPPRWPTVPVAEPASWFGRAMQGVGTVVGIAKPDGRVFVKRVIATGGQTVMCCDADGSITVDGKAITENYIGEPDPWVVGRQDCTTLPHSRRCFGPITLGPEQLWMMGDNRAKSADSRFYGAISLDDVIGKAAYVVAPLSRFQDIDDPDIQR